MRILFVHCQYQEKGGEDVVVQEEMRMQGLNGSEVDLLLFTNTGNSFAKLISSPFNLKSFLKLKKRIRDFRPDIVHLHNFHFAASASVIHAVKKANIPMVITLHNYRLLCPSATLFHKGQIMDEEIGNSFPWKAVRKGVYRDSVVMTFWLAATNYLHRQLGTFNYPDLYIVLTSFAKELIGRSSLKLAEEKIVVKSNFTNRPQLSLTKQSNRYLFVGRLTEEKGIMTLLDAFASSGHQVDIIGDGPLREEVMRYSNNFPGITYHGLQEREQVLEMMQQSTALVFPSTWYEGMPMTIIEAFSCGCPVIASNIGAMSSMITSELNGLHFEAGNAVQLEKTLDKWEALTATEKKRMRFHAFQTYQSTYTPEINTVALLDIYNMAITSHYASRLQVVR